MKNKTKHKLIRAGLLTQRKPLTNAERLAQWVLKGGIEKRRELYA